MAIKITGKKALALLEDVVAGEGADYIYQQPENSLSCKYVHNGEASCGVARAINTAGVDIKTLGIFDSLGPISSFLRGMIYRVDGDYLRSEVTEKVTMTKKAVQVFAAFQYLQDRRVPWGDCLENARLAQAAEFDAEETAQGGNYIDVHDKYDLATDEDDFKEYFVKKPATS